MDFITTISPLTNVRILSGVPLDNSYTDTLTFASASAQYTYFSEKTKYNKVNMTPVRMQNQIAVDVVADSLYDCNYLMFQNKNFGNKWFYAFITAIDFININTSNITFELDVWQTWYFDVTVKECMVEREHISNDAIGANLVPEGLEYGEYTYNAVSQSKIRNVKRICVASTTALDGTSYEGGAIIHGMYQGCGYHWFDASDAGVTAVNEYLKKLTDGNKVDGVVSVFMAWGAMINDGTLTDNAPARPTTIDGYTPRNNKLYTDPYIKLIAFDGAGSSCEYQYEYFNNPSAPTFELEWDVSPNPSIYTSPNGYRGNGKDLYKMCTTGFPQCSFNIDTYKAWLAQNGGVVGTAFNFGNSLVGGAVGAVGSAMSGNPLAVGAGVGSMLATTFDAFREVTIKKALPPTYSGTNSPTTLMANNDLSPKYCSATIRSEFAQRIDDFFDRFGYKTNRLKVPNITGRPSWNYVKTISATVTGSVPFGDITKIKATLNNGITFWHGDFVGDYGRGNK